MYMCVNEEYSTCFSCFSLDQNLKENNTSQKHHSIIQCEVSFALCESIYDYCFVFQSDRDCTWALNDHQAV